MGFYFDMIYVGHGDSFLLTLDKPGGGMENILIDAGDGTEVDGVINYVKEYSGGVLDMAIGTHVDDDHIIGFKRLLQEITVKRLVLNPDNDLDRIVKLSKSVRSMAETTEIAGIVKSVATAKTVLSIARDMGIPVESAFKGQSWAYGDIVLNVLHPQDPEKRSRSEQEPWDALMMMEDKSTEELSDALRKIVSTTSANNSSIVIELVYRGKPYALLTGDIGGIKLRTIAAKQYPFLKVAHHGSDTSLDEDLIRQISPELAFISSGRVDKHGDPTDDILRFLKKCGVATVCSAKPVHCAGGGFAEGPAVISLVMDKPARAGFSPMEQEVWSPAYQKRCKC